MMISIQEPKLEPAPAFSQAPRWCHGLGIQSTLTRSQIPLQLSSSALSSLATLPTLPINSPPLCPVVTDSSTITRWVTVSWLETTFSFLAEKKNSSLFWCVSFYTTVSLPCHCHLWSSLSQTLFELWHLSQNYHCQSTSCQQSRMPRVSLYLEIYFFPMFKRWQWTLAPLQAGATPKACPGLGCYPELLCVWELKPWYPMPWPPVLLHPSILPMVTPVF